MLVSEQQKKAGGIRSDAHLSFFLHIGFFCSRFIFFTHSGYFFPVVISNVNYDTEKKISDERINGKTHTERESTKSFFPNDWVTAWNVRFRHLVTFWLFFIFFFCLLSREISIVHMNWFFDEEKFAHKSTIQLKCQVENPFEWHNVT